MSLKTVGYNEFHTLMNALRAREGASDGKPGYFCVYWYCPTETDAVGLEIMLPKGVFWTIPQHIHARAKALLNEIPKVGAHTNVV